MRPSSLPHSLARRAALAAAIVGLLASSAAHATSTVYSTAAAFNMAAPGLETYDFPADNAAESRPYIDGPLGFSTTQHFTHPFLVDDGAYGSGDPYLALIGVPGVNAAMDTQLDGMFALSFDLGTFDGADTITVKINFNDTVGTFKTSGGAGTSTFFGIVSSEPITQISFTAKSGTQIDVLDFEAQSTAVSAVPEPASASMGLAGLGLLALLGRRRKSTRA